MAKQNYTGRSFVHKSWISVPGIKDTDNLFSQKNIGLM